MGSQYSVGPFPKEARDYANMDLIQIQAKIYRFERTIDREYGDNAFMNRKQFQWTFQLGDKATYSLFRRFDPHMKGYIPALDLWGALVLASNSTATEKINFLFGLVDLDRDDHLSPVDLSIIMRCSTRGFSNFKEILQVPLKTVHVMTDEACSREGVELNESGHIHVRDLRPYLLVDDKARTYFANLGTLIVVEDSSKLIEQREDLLKELAEVENELYELETSTLLSSEDVNMYQTERGGDSHLVRLTEKLLVNVTKKANADEAAAAIANGGMESVELSKAEQQKERRRLRAMLGRNAGEDSDSEDEFMAKTGGVFSRGCKQVTMTGGGGSEAAIQDAILFKWSTLKPQARDELVKLDLDTLLDVFESAGISMSDEHAMLCLRNIPTNTLGRHSVYDVLRWLRQYQVNPPATDVAKWRANFAQYRQNFEDFCKWINEKLEHIIEQDRLSKEVSKYTDSLEEKKEAKAAAEKTAKEALTNKPAPQILRHMSSSFAHQGKKPKKAGGGLLGDGSFSKFVKGSIRMSGWQKHQLNETPSKVSFLGPFGPALKKARQSTTSTVSPPKSPMAKHRKKQNVDERINWHGKVRFEFHCKPEGKKRDPLVGKDGILREFDKITAGDFINHFDNIGYVAELSDAEIATMNANAAARAAGLSISSPTGESSGAAKTSGSICWVVLDVAAHATSQEAYTLLKTSTNFFESVPLDYRHEVYTAVKSQMFFVESNDGTADHSDVDNSSKAPKPGTQLPRVICIALLHSVDHFKTIEDKIKAVNLLFSRAFRYLSLDLRILKSLDELYTESEEYCAFEDKLFGPQEDELGEEGMNPLRFAKLCRKRQQAAQEAIQNAPSMTTELLREHLKMRGWSDKGKRPDLISRAQEAFKRQAELVGYGEISGFGASMVQKIFDIFDDDNDAAWSLMEINKFLVATGAETLYDGKAYKSLIQQEGFHSDNHNRLTVEGLTAYYEKYGRLARDMRLLGIGSVSRCAQGELELRAQYEKEAFASLFGILEKNSLSQGPLKRILGLVSSVKECFLTGSFPQIDQIMSLFRMEKVKALQDLHKGIKTPGWLAHVIHSCCAWLADGDEGLVPALRKNNKEVFGKYSNFVKVFEKMHAPEVEVVTQESDDEDEDNTFASTDYTNSTAEIGNASVLDDFQARSLETEINDASRRKELADMFQVFYKNVMVKAIDAEDGDILEEEICRPLPPKHAEINKWDENLQAALPRVIGYSSAKTLTVTEINQRLDGAAAIYKRLSGTDRLTRTERERLQDTKVKCEQRAMFLAKQLEDSVHLCGAHFVAFYDAFRLYGGGIRQIGGGTLDLGFNIHFSGIEFVHFLPPGLGEASAARQKAQDKYERAMQRKNAALNAIERERLRRDLDEEEKARRREWELANVQLARDEEEKDLFGEAYSALVGAREEKLSIQDVEEILGLWKELLRIREERYPDTLKLAVCQNDVACVLMEVGSRKPVWIAEALSLFRQCVHITMIYLQDTLECEFHITESATEADSKLEKLLEEKSVAENSQNRELDQASQNMGIASGKDVMPGECEAVSSASSSHGSNKPNLIVTEYVRNSLEPHSPASLALLLQNYLTALRLTNNTEELHDDGCAVMKEALYSLHFCLTEKEKNNIHIERAMELLTILPLGDVHDQLDLSMKELDGHRQEYHKRMEQERLQKRLQEYNGKGGMGRKAGLFLTKDDQRAGIDVMALVDPKKAKRIKFKREQRAARKRRNVSIKQRNKMYRMIASGEISDFFERQAKKVDEDSDVTWGDDHLANVEDPFAVSEGEESESDDDSFFSADIKKATKSRDVDHSLSTISFVDSGDKSKSSKPSLDEGDKHSADDESVGSSNMSDLSNPTMQMRHLTDSTPPVKPQNSDQKRRRSSIMSWLLRNRGVPRETNE